MKTLIDYDAGYKANEAIDIVYSIQGEMTFFPLCCSTGVLKNVACTRLTDSYGDSKFTATLPDGDYAEKLQKVKEANYIHDMIRVFPCDGKMIYPIEVAQLNALSLCLAKCQQGKDDGPSGGYNNYKAAQITMFDRYLPDKGNKEFKFTYNEVYSVDHLQAWLAEQDGVFGEFFLSTPTVGAHGARVRGSVWTVDKNALEEYLKPHVEVIREHILGTYEWHTKNAPKAKPVDKVAASW